jgi:hypothetical protein
VRHSVETDIPGSPQLRGLDRYAPTAAAIGPVTVEGFARPPERNRPQRIAFTLRTVAVFPMTHHAECVALLTKTGFDLH